jgi:hypothetical protein
MRVHSICSRFSARQRARTPRTIVLYEGDLEVSQGARDRDSSIERLLARTLEARASAATDACLDAETVAAYADGALAADERTAVEAHAADCARCQALLAAMATTAPPNAPPARARRLARGWLIPLAAAAAAVAIWVAVPNQAPVVRERPEPSAQIAETKPAAPPPSASSAGTAKAPAQPAAPVERRQTRPALQRDEPAQKKLAPAPSREDSKALASKEALKDVDALAPPASANAAPPRVTVQAQAPRAASALMKSEARAFAARTMPAIVSPDTATQWRLVDGGAVQRTIDGGATWETQQTGVTETLTAGASPSGSVCWLTGPHGIVLLSVDGRTWRRIAFPEDVPLVAVTAADDRNATVTAADGRTFATTDAGETWSRSR